MLLRIAYCDDEIENGKKIRDYINQLMIQIEVEFELDFYVSGTVLLENVKKQNDYYDMVLLDMEMPDMNGIEIAEKIRELVSREVLITFLTSYPEYMQKSFGVQVFQYLLKPITYDVFKKEIIRTIQYIEKDNASILVTDGDTGYCLLYTSPSPRDAHEVMEITLEKSKMNAKGNISDYEDKLVQNHFIRISRNCIVNMKFIHSFFEREIRMTTGKRVEMSRRKITEVKEVFTKYLVLGGNHK